MAFSFSRAPPCRPFHSLRLQAFETPVASRVRARPQSWHGSNPPGSAKAGGGGGGEGEAGAMQAPLSTMSVRSVAGSSVSGSSSKGRAADHMLVFSVCQATFYVMCFRGDELAAMDGFGDQVPCSAGMGLLSCVARIFGSLDLWIFGYFRGVERPLKLFRRAGFFRVGVRDEV